MGIVNDIAGNVALVLFLAFGWMHPVLLILALSLLVAVLSLFIFKWTSNQPAIRRSKGKVKAHLLALVIFRHDLKTVFKSLGLALLGSLANIRFLVLPLLVMFIPLTLLFVQFDLRLGYRGLEPGEETVLRVHVREEAALDDIRLEGGESAAVVTPGVRVNDPERELLEVDWRIRAGEPGRGSLTLTGDESKRITVDVPRALLSPRRPSNSLLDRLFNPGEPPLPAEGGIAAIDLAYPPVFYEFLGIEWAWWTLFLVFMILGLFLLRGPLKVQF